MLSYSEHDEGRGMNYWEVDPALRDEVQRVYTDDEYRWAEERLSRFGELVGERVADNSDTIDDSPPSLETYDRYGDIVNRVGYHPAQKENDRTAYENGAVADSFDAPDGRGEPMPLTHSLAHYYLICYCDIGLACSVSMTGGAALVLEQCDDEGRHDGVFGDLTARDLGELRQGAMFLTEEQGGSDVGANETIAEPTGEEGVYELTGEKWFCSNIDAGAALVLARRPDAPEGTDGLSLFVLKQDDELRESGDVYYRRLKDKLGTKSVPTGEVELRGARARLVGEPERGFRYMTEMLNYERLTNAVGSCGTMARALLESKVHAADREAFGKPIERYPLMKKDLVDMTVTHETATAVSFEAADALNAYVRDQDDEAYRAMRVLVPVAKYRTGEDAVEMASYAMEVLGGNGYVEEFVTERLLRDVQVTPIWEGTSNILALDVLRGMAKEGAHTDILDRIDGYLDEAEHEAVASVAETVAGARDELEEVMNDVATAGVDRAQLRAKDLADLIYDVYASALLVSEAERDARNGDGRKALVARRFVDRNLGDGRITDDTPLKRYEEIAKYGTVDVEEL
ncbi:acyl-CoA dehydrogenase family protein [Haladaptatus sp. F3-133]|uniref:Acyl-CoA dehydrogenase family protein n=1 Tax=Halorutilus salinus TaxID=2487751 RepID=A0A9Q4GIJ9_9EURY|nr:acyl-CoA dehydrogenase family protein [Halorutilus salinus]MCX2819950.1 acyl-CoA dehydrogenase family protein [Halorutilus salinus]